MPAIELTTTIAAPRSEVWEDFRHIERHVEWMHDAVRITFLSDLHEGIGTTFQCTTKVGPFVTEDIMRVTQWDDGRAVGVAHAGLISGEGVFSLADAGDDTLLTWREELHFPWWLGGGIAATVAAPILRFIWRKNLKNFSARFTSSQ